MSFDENVAHEKPPSKDGVAVTGKSDGIFDRQTPMYRPYGPFDLIPGAFQFRNTSICAFYFT